MAMLLQCSWMVLYCLIVMAAVLLAKFTLAVATSMGYFPALDNDHPVRYHVVDAGLCVLVGWLGFWHESTFPGVIVALILALLSLFRFRGPYHWTR
jgi:hypothetical protein